MKKTYLGIALAASAMAAPSSAALLLPGTTGVPFLPFATATQGTQLVFNSTAGVARTFAGTLRSAVYLNSLNTLDFYFQFMRTGNGSRVSDGKVARITAASFAGFDVEGFSFDGDVDGSGGFTAATTSGAGSTAERSEDGAVLRMVFGRTLDGLTTGSTYIFRTNATRYDDLGTFGVINGSTFEGDSFEPAHAVPEPSTWALLFGGFAMIGARLRRRQRALRTVSA